MCTITWDKMTAAALPFLGGVSVVYPVVSIHSATHPSVEPVMFIHVSNLFVIVYMIAVLGVFLRLACVFEVHPAWFLVWPLFSSVVLFSNIMGYSLRVVQDYSSIARDIDIDKIQEHSTCHGFTLTNSSARVEYEYAGASDSWPTVLHDVYITHYVAPVRSNGRTVGWMTAETVNPHMDAHMLFARQVPRKLSRASPLYRMRYEQALRDACKRHADVCENTSILLADTDPDEWREKHRSTCLSLLSVVQVCMYTAVIVTAALMFTGFRRRGLYVAVARAAALEIAEKSGG
jgi:hypothetical protein